MKYITLSMLFAGILFSCNRKTNVQEFKTEQQTNNIILENKTDPICDMAVDAHKSDTALINNKIWGFCSSACKEKYLNSK